MLVETSILAWMVEYFTYGYIRYLLLKDNSVVGNEL